MWHYHETTPPPLQPPTTQLPATHLAPTLARLSTTSGAGEVLCLDIRGLECAGQTGYVNKAVLSTETVAFRVFIQLSWGHQRKRKHTNVFWQCGLDWVSLRHPTRTWDQLSGDLHTPEGHATANGIAVLTAKHVNIVKHKIIISPCLRVVLRCIKDRKGTTLD